MHTSDVMGNYTPLNPTLLSIFSIEKCNFILESLLHFLGLS